MGLSERSRCGSFRRSGARAETGAGPGAAGVLVVLELRGGVCRVAALPSASGIGSSAWGLIFE